MMKEYSLLDYMIINVFIIVLWETIIFFVCSYSDNSMFDDSRRLYKEKKWEKEGRWYRNFLFINKWKDFLPQLSGKRVFSKKHLENVSEDYINKFILETCRGEWDHLLNVFISIPLLLLEKTTIALPFVIFLLVTNIPYICIQRYNRLRLKKLRNRIKRNKSSCSSNIIKGRMIEEDAFSKFT